RIPSSPQRATSSRPASVSPAPVSGLDGARNGTPSPNQFGRLQTGPSERSPASYQNGSASSSGSIASAPSTCRTAAGGSAGSSWTAASPAGVRAVVISP